MSQWPKLDTFKARTIMRYGVKCDFSEIDSTDATIKDAYEYGYRVNFNYSNDGVKPAQGYVGLTTGWKPAFIRLHNKRSMGGCDTLTHARAMGYSNPRNKVNRWSK